MPSLGDQQVRSLIFVLDLCGRDPAAFVREVEDGAVRIVGRDRLRVDRVGKRELLTSPIGASIGEGDLQKLFEGEELRIMLFNY
jgi:hypothetical protein